MLATVVTALLLLLPSRPHLHRKVTVSFPLPHTVPGRNRPADLREGPELPLHEHVCARTAVASEHADREQQSRLAKAADQERGESSILSGFGGEKWRIFYQSITENCLPDCPGRNNFAILS